AAGAPAPDLHAVALTPLLRDVVAGTVLERGITVTVEADDALHVTADEQTLTSAISNLVQNAVKFSRDGARIFVRAYRDEGTITTEVEDGWGGLPDEDTERLFEPFVQQSGDRRGVGLGLAIT